MKKTITFLLLLAISISGAYSQNISDNHLQDTVKTSSPKNNALFLEIGGPSGGVELNYELRFKNPKYGFRVGCAFGYSKEKTSVPGLINSKATTKSILFPIGLNLITGTRKHHFEMGFGTTLEFSKVTGKLQAFAYAKEGEIDSDNTEQPNYSISEDISKNMVECYLTTTFGYRYQAKSGFLFRVGAAPVYRLTHKDASDRFGIEFYLSFGWAF